MKYSFIIDLDKETDLWNWLDAVKYGESYGFNWRDNLKSDDDRAIYDKASKMTEDNAKLIISSYLDKLYDRKKTEINLYKEFINKIYESKFKAACDKIEEITGKTLFFKKYTIYLTTFPRCPYDEQDGSLFTRINDSEVMGTFMHEVLHFQFHKYWQEDSNSPVSKLSDDDFHFLKESLTVVLDNDIVPLIEIYDRGYESHRDFRKVLHENWKKYHDFEKLVDFGLKRLPEYTGK